MVQLVCRSAEYASTWSPPSSLSFGQSVHVEFRVADTATPPNLLHLEYSFRAAAGNGTSGDINNWNPKTGPKSPAPYTNIRKVANDVAQEVFRAVQRMQHAPGDDPGDRG